jgi:hypothetical protein
MESTNEYILSVLRKAIEELKSLHLRSEVLNGLLEPPMCQRRTCLTDKGEAQCDLWIFYIVPDKDIALAYSEEGYGAIGIRWGLVFLHNDEYGSSDSWYSSLHGLLVESGYVDVD